MNISSRNYHKAFPRPSTPDETIEIYLREKSEKIQDNGAPGIPVFASITLNQENKSLS